MDRQMLFSEMTDEELSSIINTAWLSPLEPKTYKQLNARINLMAATAEKNKRGSRKDKAQPLTPARWGVPARKD